MHEAEQVTLQGGPEPEFSPEQELLFSRAAGALARQGIRFLVAGALGLYHHTGFWRGTKDLDLLVLRRDRERAVRVVTGIGFRDLFEEEPYDRAWLYRATQGPAIVDLIWCHANRVDEVDASWFERGVTAEYFGQRLEVAGPADICWMKLFVLQRGRCDWPDIVNVIRGTRGRMDWDHLLARSGEHWRLLAALVDLYDWLCPAERHFIPGSFRRAVERARRGGGAGTDGETCRAHLLDSRPWLTEAGSARGPFGAPPAAPPKAPRRPALDACARLLRAVQPQE